MEKLKPILRFPGFLSEWKKRRFGDLYTFKSTNSFSRDKLNYDDGEVYNIHYGDIHVKFRSNFKLQLETVPFINADLNLSKIGVDNYCQEGDLIIADASENYDDIGKSIEIIDLNNKRVVAGLHTFLARPITDQLMKGYGGYLMQTTSVKDQIKIIAQGTKVLGISTKRVADLKLILPETSEQIKIAEFLTAIDKRIELLTAKKEKLILYKKGVMQKIFNQEIRFKDENGEEFPEWTPFNAGDLFASITNKNHNSDLPILAITQEHGAIPRNMIDYNISVSEKSVDSYKVVEKGDFIISLRSFQGGIEYSNYLGICSPAYIILKPKVAIVDQWFKYFFKTDSYIVQLNEKLEGIRDGKMISYKYFSETRINLPSLTEQKKISEFILSIDAHIQKVEQQITLNQTYKKGLLQQMFV